jgi:iron complex outermembrane receptor protein
MALQFSYCKSSLSRVQGFIGRRPLEFAPIYQQQGDRMLHARTALPRLLLLLVLPVIGFSTKVGAQQVSSSATGLEEIVVTATRRRESIQSVPMSITAVTEASLEKRAATTFFDYGSSIPNLSFGYSSGGSNAGLSSSRSIAIRGIEGDGTTGFYIDDTPVPVSIDPKVMDIKQIEILRGPQGTLYGALSMGGTVRILTQQPDTQQMSILAHSSVSDTDHATGANYQVDGALNLPLIENKLAIRISAVHEQLGGYFKRYAEDTGSTVDNVGKSMTDGGEVAMLWQLTDDLSATPRVMYQRSSLDGLPLALVRYDAASVSPVAIRPSSLTITEPFNVAESSQDEWSLSSVDFKYHRPWGTIVFSSSYFNRRTMDTEDQTVFIAQVFGISPIPTSISDQTHPRVQTEEVRFASSFSGPFQLVGGLYYQHTNTSGVAFPDNIIPGINAATGGALGTDLVYYSAGREVTIETAPYAEANYDITDHWRATAGIRSTRIQSLAGPTYGDGVANGGPTTIPLTRLTDTTTTPKFSLQYRFNPDNQIYATAAKGFRPGIATGGQVPAALCAADLAKLGIPTVDGQVGPVQPDTVWSYEVGEKTTWMDQRLTVNFDVFRINWNKIQQQELLACGFPFTANAGAARSQGAEIDISARITEGLSLELSGGFDDAKFTETVPGVLFQSGDRVPQVPRESVQFDADYQFPIGNDLTGFAHADYRYVGNSWSTNNSNTNPTTGRVVPLIRPAYRIADLRAGVRHNKTEYAIFVKNLTNELANLSDTNAIAAQAVGESRVAVSPPRTIGVEFRYRY